MHMRTAALVWLRRDLRLADNAALHAALGSAQRVYCAFVFDTAALDALASRRDRRVEFVRESLVELNDALAQRGSALIVRHGNAREEIPRLASQLGVAVVFANRDYEPFSIARDVAIAHALAALGIDWHTRKDHVVFEHDELRSPERKPITVFSAYRQAWLRRLVPYFYQSYAVEERLGALARMDAVAVPELRQLGFETTNLQRLGLPTGASGAAKLLDDFLSRIDRYRELRDYPAVRGTSYLSLHLRFGTVSIRRLVGLAAARPGDGAQAWLGELIWRDFLFSILHAHPRVTEHAFHLQMDAIAFSNDPRHFDAWCEARTGYPLVDAGMRQLTAAGFLSNRMRMITASFLVKDLHVDWRWGERYFAQHLNDHDLAANNGNWQWAASTGCEAQPYFRIFNPITQSEQFDPTGAYIRKYLPELARVPAEHIHAPWRAPRELLERAGVTLGRSYPEPIVDHQRARAITLCLYAGSAPS